MRKTAAFVLTLIVILALFSGCTGNDSGPVKGNVRLVDRSGKVWLTKDDFREITLKESDRGDYSLVLTLTNEGRVKFKEVTRIVSNEPTNVLDIYVDDDIVSSPKVIDEIDSDVLLITLHKKEEAMTLANRIRNPVEVQKSVPSEDLTLPEEKVPSHPDDIRYSGNVSIKRNVQSAKVELTLSKDMKNVTSTRILFEGVSFVVNLTGGTKSISIGSMEVASEKILPVDNGRFTWDLGREGLLAGEIKANGEIEGTLHYIYQGVATELDTFDLGEWPWSAQKLD